METRRIRRCLGTKVYMDEGEITEPETAFWLP